jgi:hypothetical protein
MSTMTASNVEELLPAARQLAVDLGRIPGLAVLKKELKIGEPRAEETSPEDPSAEEVPPWTETFGEDLPEDPSPEADEEALPVVGRVDPSPVPAGTPEAIPVVASVTSPKTKKEIVLWPLLIIVLPAFVAIWGGWVDLGQMAGFGDVNLLPGLTDKAVINLSITLPVGLEAYASYAIYVWLSLDEAKDEALRRFAKWSAGAALVVGGLGQGIYHLLKAFDQVKAPWPVVIFVALIPVVVSGLGAYLAHGVRHGRSTR